MVKFNELGEHLEDDRYVITWEFAQELAEQLVKRTNEDKLALVGNMNDSRSFVKTRKGKISRMSVDSRGRVAKSLLDLLQFGVDEDEEDMDDMFSQYQ